MKKECGSRPPGRCRGGRFSHGWSRRVRQVRAYGCYFWARNRAWRVASRLGMKTLSLLLASVAAFACIALHAANPEDPGSQEAIARRLGWEQESKRGKEIIEKLAKMNAEELGKVDITAYRDERVAFRAGTA